MSKIKFSYYPGCTLRTKASKFNESVKAITSTLGIELEELPEWTCCGAVMPLITDNLINLIAPIRNLIYAKKSGYELVTVCSFCYNVLKRTNKTVKENPERLRRINEFIGEEYDGSTRVFHLLEILRDKMGFKNLEKKIKKPLKGLKVAPYYGCMLLRPAEIGVDDPEKPSIFEDLIESLGCEVVDFPFKTECCGSYLTISSPEAALHCSHNILSSAVKNGAEVVVTSCPLCYFNLSKQEEIVKSCRDFKGVPIAYFSRLLELALGMPLMDESAELVEVLKGKDLL